MLTKKKLDLRKSRQEISQDSRAIKKRGHHARLPLTIRKIIYSKLSKSFKQLISTEPKWLTMNQIEWHWKTMVS